MNLGSTLQYTRDALLKLKQSIDQNGSVLSHFDKTPISKPHYKMFSADKSPVAAKKNTINLGKLSLALKMSPSPVERFMPADGQVNNIASILHETLAKLKRPNKHFLKPLQLPVNAIKNSNMFDCEQPVESKQNKEDFKNYRKRKLIKQVKEVSPVNEQAPEVDDTDEMVDEVELDLDELTQEDKFYLI